MPKSRTQRTLTTDYTDLHPASLPGGAMPDRQMGFEFGRIIIVLLLI